MPFHQGAGSISPSHSCGLSLVYRVWVGGVRNSRWCPTRSGLALGRHWCGHGSAAGAQSLLLGNSQSCCAGCRGQGGWCGEAGAAELTSKACLCSAICSSPCIWYPWVLLSPWSPPLPLKLVEMAPVIVCGWVGEEAVGWGGHGGGCYRRLGCRSSTLQCILSSSLGPFSCPRGLGSLSCSLGVTLTYPVKPSEM